MASSEDPASVAAATPAKDGGERQATNGKAKSENVDVEAPSVLDTMSQRSYATFSHRSVALMLTNAMTTGVLGSGPREKDTSEYSLFAKLMASMPWRMLAAQAVWSTVVMLFGYAIGDKKLPTLGVEFWSSRYVVSTSVVYMVGWALFVLLGFLISEASGRYREGLCVWSKLEHYLRQLVRHFIQAYDEGSWHEGDMERIVAHLVAYPIALKMWLRGEREEAQLEKILCKEDLKDLMESEEMHMHCTRVIRSYHIVMEDDAKWVFDKVPAEKTPAGWGTRYLLMDIMDAVDAAAGVAAKIANTGPAVGYINHLRIFMYIWFFFLPMSIVASSGWFTVLWSVLITYGVGMLYVISHALNEPFGFDLQDIKLNRLAAQIGLTILNCYSKDQLQLTHVIRPERNTPNWLESKEAPVQSAADAGQAQAPPPTSWLGGFLRLFTRIRFRPMQRQIFIPVSIFSLWVAFVVFLTWGISRGDERPAGVRWWYVYIPIDSSTTAFVGLGIFLLLGFWLNDAYGRYWSGLQTWQTTIRTNLEAVTFHIGTSCKSGLWHTRDRERLFSFLAALPIALKHHLRENRDLTEFEEILAPEDVAALSEASNFPQFCLNVIHGYMNSIDREDKATFRAGRSPLMLRGMIYTIQYTLWATEIAIEQMEALRRFPISESFTTHLHVFTVFWLAVLPLTTVLHDGFFSFLYMIPIAYSVIKLLTMGKELADPFGYDRHDIPVDMFCDEFKQSIYKIYHLTAEGRSKLIKASPYSRAELSPKYLKLEEACGDRNGEGVVRNDRQSTILGSIRKFVEAAPSVHLKSQIIVSVWSVIAVLVSYGLSFTWGDRRDNCREWCSPIDVNSNVLVNIGFALFMILSFRAYDAIARYEDGAELVYEVKMRLRNLAIEVVQNIKPSLWHDQDQERIVAIAAQIPLELRDALLGIRREDPADKEGLLSDEDRLAMESSEDAISYLLRVLQTYMVTMDSQDPEIARTQREDKAAVHLTATMLGRMTGVEKLINKARGTKRFPVVRSYTSHQAVFTWIWLFLLPLAMAPATGFFTILWAPLISYGVLALESIAVKLVDPFGTDSIDLPLDKMCRDAASAVLEGVHSVQWGCSYHIRESSEVGEPGIGMVVNGTQVHEEYSLPHLSKKGDAKDTEIEFEGPREFKEKPSLYAHITHSVPWWILIYVSAYTALAVLISFVSRRRDVTGVRWWVSRISIDGTVAANVSFAAFLLLGFFVQAAFARYNAAGSVWGDNLRSACHSLAAQWMTLAEAGTWHEGDKDRVIAHIAALPIVLKLDMRNSRDVRELKGLLSEGDIGRLQVAESMISHCVDVVRSYYLAQYSHPDLLAKPENAVKSAKATFVKFDIISLERAIRTSEFVKEFNIAPGFLNLLDALLLIWFALIPFVLAELSGWWTILWVPIIAYGIFGMKAVAEEIQHPFGFDLNDLDLDTMADSITKDVLEVHRNYKDGLSALILEEERISAPIWNVDVDNTDEVSTVAPATEEAGEVSKTKIRVPSYFCEMWRLARHAVPYWVLAAVGGWTVFGVLLTWLLRHRDAEFSCGTWWCSAIDVDDGFKGYIGFALFLLLGLQLYDSHGRYVKAIAIWGGLKFNTRLFANRFFQSNHSDVFHPGDMERIAGHLAAYAVTTVSELRDGEDCEKELLKLLSHADVQRVLRVTEKADYCLDVVRGYLIRTDELKIAGRLPSGGNEQWIYYWYQMLLRETGAECERIVRVPLPYGYVQHLRIFLLIWILLLPLGLVKAQGPFAILWAVVIAYGVIGIERWSSELANPFGHDLSDVPLEKFRDEVVQYVKELLNTFKGDGAVSFVKSDRQGFPVLERSAF